MEGLSECAAYFGDRSWRADIRATPLGQFFAVFLEEFGDGLVATVVAGDEAEGKACEELTGMPVSNDRTRHRRTSRGDSYRINFRSGYTVRLSH